MLQPSSPLDLMPWYLLPYLANPVVSYVALPGGASAPMLTGDPQRVLFIVGAPQGTNITLSPDPNLNGTTKLGLALSSTIGPFIMSYWLYGPLVCVPWFLFSGTSVTITVVSQSMNDEVGKEVDKVAELVKQQPKKPVPQVRGILADYWHKLTGRG